jgi:hypothetical protein
LWAVIEWTYSTMIVCTMICTTRLPLQQSKLIN